MGSTVGGVAGRYEVQEVEFGMVYRWCPERVVVDCGCGERLALASSETVCGCGVDHASVVREGLDARRRSGDEDLHPWRYAGEREVVGIHY